MSPIVSKPLEMIDQSEPVNWPNVWWMLGADHLTFEGVMGDSAKMSCRLISRGKKHANKFLGEKYPALKKNIAHDVQC